MNKKRIILGIILGVINMVITHAAEAPADLSTTPIYKIIEPSDFNPGNRNCCIQPTALDIKSKFMHASLGKQVAGTIKKFFTKIPKILLVELDQTKLDENGIKLRMEANEPGGAKYPHLYPIAAASTMRLTVKKILAQAGDGTPQTIKDDSAETEEILLPAIPYVVVLKIFLVTQSEDATPPVTEDLTAEYAKLFVNEPPEGLRRHP